MVDLEETRATIWLPIAIAARPLHRPRLLLLRSYVDHEFSDARGQRRGNQAGAEPKRGNLLHRIRREPRMCGVLFV